ncbi:MAG: hypothetical protein ACE14V_02395 [bacterium]
MAKRISIFLIGFIGLLFGWSISARDSFQDLSNDIQYQSANTQEGLKNYQLCFDISKDWWNLHEPELALDFLYAAAREAEQLLPAKVSAAKLLELAAVATKEYRDRYTAEDMIEKARAKMKFILDYYEWQIPYQEANRIEKEAERLQYLPRGKYIPRQVILPVPSGTNITKPDIVSYTVEEPVNRMRYANQPPGGFDNTKPPKSQSALGGKPELKKPKEPPAKPDKPPKPKEPPDKPKPPDKPPKPPEPPKPPDKPPKPPDKPPIPPPANDTTK